MSHLESLIHYPQIVQEAASYSHETKRIPDPYLFYFDQVQRKLTPPGSSVPVENYIRRNTPIDLMEAEAFEKIQKMVEIHNSGIILWVSPPTEVYRNSTTTKIIVGEIKTEVDQTSQGVTKMLLNRALVLDWDLGESIGFVQELTGKIHSEYQIRTNPFYKDLSCVQAINALLLKRTDQMRMVLTNQDIKIKSETLGDINSLGGTIQVYGSNSFERLLYLRMKKLGISGQQKPHCELNAFSLLAGPSSENSFPCPKCKGPIAKGQGIEVCPHCGAKKNDYKKCD